MEVPANQQNNLREQTSNHAPPSYIDKRAMRGHAIRRENIIKTKQMCAEIRKVMAGRWPVDHDLTEDRLTTVEQVADHDLKEDRLNTVEQVPDSGLIRANTEKVKQRPDPGLIRARIDKVMQMAAEVSKSKDSRQPAGDDLEDRLITVEQQMDKMMDRLATVERRMNRFEKRFTDRLLRLERNHTSTSCTCQQSS